VRRFPLKNTNAIIVFYVFICVIYFLFFLFFFFGFSYFVFNFVLLKHNKKKQLFNDLLG